MRFFPELLGTVREPQTGQIACMEPTPHSGLVHLHRPISTVIFPFLAASMMFLRLPPCIPMGNNAWGAGFIILSFVFSGLPTLPPRYVGAFAIISTGETWFNASRVEIFFSSSNG